MSITTLFRTTPPARLRAAARAGAVVATAAVPLLVASTAFAAYHPYDGEDSGPGLTVLQTLGIYVGIPLALFCLIAFLVVLPGWIRGDRNRREVGWIGQNGATASDANAAAGRDKGVASGSPSSAEQSVSAGKSSGTGGASGSW